MTTEGDSVYDLSMSTNNYQKFSNASILKNPNQENLLRPPQIIFESQELGTDFLSKQANDLSFKKQQKQLLTQYKESNDISASIENSNILNMDPTRNNSFLEPLALFKNNSKPALRKNSSSQNFGRGSENYQSNSVDAGSHYSDESGTI